jgi:hypothetical protein
LAQVLVYTSFGGGRRAMTAYDRAGIAASFSPTRKALAAARAFGEAIAPATDRAHHVACARRIAPWRASPGLSATCRRGSRSGAGFRLHSALKRFASHLSELRGQPMTRRRHMWKVDD